MTMKRSSLLSYLFIATAREIDPVEAQLVIPKFTCTVFEEFNQAIGSCCNLNLDCESICCMDGQCAKDSPCPNYDGSIEKWEEEEYNAAIDEQEQALQETRETDEQ